MKKRVRVIVLHSMWIGLIALVFGACNGTKNVVSEETKKELQQQAESRNIKVKAEWALPLTTNAMASVFSSGLLPPGSNVARINLIGTANSFEIRGDSIYADLPYYGERRIVGSYPGGEGISFTSAIENYRTDFNRKDGAHRIRFDADDKAERYDVTVKLFPNQRAVLIFYSTQRNPIRFDGIVENPQSE